MRHFAAVKAIPFTTIEFRNFFNCKKLPASVNIRHSPTDGSGLSVSEFDVE